MKDIRLDWIDFSKGVGIILVVYGHVARGMNEAGITFSQFLNLDNFIYGFHMPLFFALSGCFFDKSLAKGEVKYIISKINTIIYPYLVWSFLQIVVKYFTSSVTNGSANINDLLTFFFPRDQFWFLLALFNISIFNLILKKFFNRRWLIVSSIIAVFSLFLPYDLGIVSKTFSHLIYFNFGVFLFEHGKIQNKILHDWSLFLTNTAIFISVGMVMLSLNLNFQLLDLLFAISGSTWIMQISYRLKNSINHISFLGKQSMLIYLLHIMVGSGSRIVLLNIFGINNVIVHVILGTVLGIYMPYLFWYLGFYKKLYFLFESTFYSNKQNKIEG